MWSRSLFIICTIWTFIAGSIFFVLVLVGLRDLLIWVLIFVPVILIFFFMYGIIAMNERQRPGWSVVQITRKYFIYTWAYTPDLDFLEMVRSEDPVIYPLVAAELESITEIKKGFGSSFVRENPGGPEMVVIAAKFGPGSSYGEGWEEEFPIPLSILPALLKKVREIAPTIKIEAGLEKT